MKTNVIQIRLSDKEKEGFSKASESAGLSISEWARNILNDAANGIRWSNVRDINKEAIAIGSSQFDNYLLEIQKATRKTELLTTYNEVSKDANLGKSKINVLQVAINKRIKDDFFND